MKFLVVYRGRGNADILHRPLTIRYFNKFLQFYGYKHNHTFHLYCGGGGGYSSRFIRYNLKEFYKVVYLEFALSLVPVLSNPLCFAVWEDDKMCLEGRIRDPGIL